ncbi:uncharacterized protein LOC101847229 [Aplysia californica]|uniref:Uncharacterized protein LOC101847229 n=1 Tax=Aplysia californica TaxID=6500 RepID=A0ABM0JAR0_APLCA|nr:uncharacterized protein LOC101847229 [Aplysia californica]
MDYDPTWIEQFISLIEKKPVLYNKNSDEYADKDKKKKAWVEVCEAMIENWEDLSQEERQVKGNEVQGRWKNLRTCFARELRAQTKGVSGQAAKKRRRKYIYFERLMFLHPTIEDRRETKRDETVHETTRSTEAEQQVLDEDEAQSIQNRLSQPGPSRSKKRQEVSFEETLLNILRDKHEEIDEDKSFLLSLLPAMKRIRSEEHKCEAKIEMLRITNKYQFMDSQPSVKK